MGKSHGRNSSRSPTGVLSAQRNTVTDRYCVWTLRTADAPVGQYGDARYN